MVFLEQDANWAAESIRKGLLIPPDRPPEIGIVLGTGWGDLLRLSGESRMPLIEASLMFNDLVELHGHKRELGYGQVAGKSVLALRGRVHLNEKPYDQRTAMAVRLQVQMMVALGIKTFILTNAAGALGNKCRVGDIVVVDGFVSLFAPDLPVSAGEFCSPDDVLDRRFGEGAVEIAETELGANDDDHPLVRRGGYVMMRGPFFEGRRYDKPLLRQSGATCVGMSSLPEAAVIAATCKEPRVLVLSYITNSDTEQHSHEENVRRAKQVGPRLGKILEEIIAQS